MYYLGVDFHKNYSHLALMDEKGEILKQGKIGNGKGSVADFIKPYKGEIKSVMEATRNWDLMYNWLEDVSLEVKLAHPLKVKVIGEAKIKTDKISAEVLAQLLRTGFLPEAYAPSREMREAREILRQRMFFVRVQTMVKNRIRRTIDKHPELERPKFKEVFGTYGIEWLREISLPEIPRKLLDQELKLLLELKERIKENNWLIEELARGNGKVKRLISIPGIGRFFAVLILSEIGDIKRFRNPNKLAAYVGLVPSTYASGGKVFHGRIIKQGNKWLRWAFVEAIWPAIVKDKGLRYYYNCNLRKGANRAKVATARRLLKIVYHVLSEDREYKCHQLPSCDRSCVL